MIQLQMNCSIIAVGSYGRYIVSVYLAFEVDILCPKLLSNHREKLVVAMSERNWVPLLLNWLKPNQRHQIQVR